MKIDATNHDFLAGMLFVVLALVAYFVVIPDQVQGDIQRGLAPTFFPDFAAAWIGVFGLCVALRGLFAQRTGDERSPPAAERRLGRRGAAATVAGALVYLGLIYLLGYVVPTLLSLALLMRLLGERRGWVIAAATLVTTFGIYLVFHGFMSVQLPEGVIS